MKSSYEDIIICLNNSIYIEIKWFFNIYYEISYRISV